MAVKSRPFVPGDRIKLTGKFLRNTGQMVGGEGQSVWTIVPCSCRACADGRFVAVDEVSTSYVPEIDGPIPLQRHILAVNVYRVGTCHVDNA